MILFLLCSLARAQSTVTATASTLADLGRLDVEGARTAVKANGDSIETEIARLPRRIHNSENEGLEQPWITRDADIQINARNDLSAVERGLDAYAAIKTCSPTVTMALQMVRARNYASDAGSSSLDPLDAREKGHATAAISGPDCPSQAALALATHSAELHYDELRHGDEKVLGDAKRTAVGWARQAARRAATDETRAIAESLALAVDRQHMLAVTGMALPNSDSPQAMTLAEGDLNLARELLEQARQVATRLPGRRGSRERGAVALEAALAGIVFTEYLQRASAAEHHPPFSWAAERKSLMRMEWALGRELRRSKDARLKNALGALIARRMGLDDSNGKDKTRSFFEKARLWPSRQVVKPQTVEFEDLLFDPRAKFLGIPLGKKVALDEPGALYQSAICDLSEALTVRGREGLGTLAQLDRAAGGGCTE